MQRVYTPKHLHLFIFYIFPHICHTSNLPRFGGDECFLKNLIWLFYAIECLLIEYSSQFFNIPDICSKYHIDSRVTLLYRLNETKKTPRPNALYVSPSNVFSFLINLWFCSECTLWEYLPTVFILSFLLWKDRNVVSGKMPNQPKSNYYLHCRLKEKF